VKKIISSALAILAISASLLAQSKITVSGIIKDEKGEPMIGVVVIEKGSNVNGVETGLDGKYTIKVSSSAFLEISCLGYKHVLEEVKGRKNIDFQLTPDLDVLEATVVIGYGTSKKGDLTGAVSVVNVDEIQNAPVLSVAQSLQGKIAGMEISSGSGDVGEDNTIRIRGSRSISAGNEPLIVVDGVVDAVSSLSEINPSDIVSISVLKDVSSTAIYGSRGANGVVLVTTEDSKRQDGVFSIKFKTSVGVSAIAGSLDLMNATEWAKWRNMCASNFGRTTPFPDPESYGEGTDWIKELTQVSVYQNYFLSCNGKVDKTDYSASFGYSNTPGTVICTGARKFTGNLNLSSNITKKLKFGINVSFSNINRDRPTISITGTSTSAAIYLSPMINITEEWNKYGDSESTGGMPFNNPYIVAHNSVNKSNAMNLMMAPTLTYKFNPRFNAKLRFAYTLNNTDTGTYSPSSLPVAKANETGGTASRSDKKTQKALGEFTLNYKKKKNDNVYEGLLGFTVENQTIDYQYYKGVGYTDDALTFYNMGGLMDPSNLTANTYKYEKLKLSVLGRFNYNYKRRYYLTLTMRADGASNFAENKKWGFFPAAAFRWSIMNENWFSRATWLNDLSLRFSAGRSGNDALNPYLSLATLQSAASSWIFGDVKQLTYTPSKLQNSNLTWETTDSYDLGFNFSGWNSRVTLELDAYLSYTRDLLLNMRNSQTTGYNTYYANAGVTRNIGQEFTLTTRNIAKRNFDWTTVLTISHNDQIVVDVGSENSVVPTYTNPRNSTQYMYGYKKGYPVNALWGYQYEGVWHNAEEIERNKVTHAYVSQIKAGSQGSGIGHPKYVDVNHDGLLDLEDMVYLGNADPILYGGFQNSFSIAKHLKLGIYFSYSIGGKIYNITELYAASGVQSYNKYRFMSGAWMPDNPDSNLPKAGFDDVQASSKSVYDASYFRLKTVDISYDIPLKKEVKKVIKGGITVGVSADNLFLLKNYPGFDPDVNTSSSVYRLDNGSYPRSRTCVVNLQIKF